MEDLDEFKEFIKKMDREDISFISYFYLKRDERPEITEELIRDKIKDLDNILGFQKQIVNKKERYRIGIRLSSRYTLVIILEIKEKGLNIITSWKTSRKWQKAIQK